jgi:hypothetical protein
VGSRPNGIDLAGENELLNFFLDLIVQFIAVVSEKFNAIVLIWIVRSGKDDAGVRPQRSRDVSHTGGGQRSNNENIYSERSDSRHQRVLQHVPGKTRVLAEHDFRTRPVGRPARIHLREHVRRGAAKFQRRLRRHRLHVCDTSHAISSKNFLPLGHGLIETLETQFVNGKVLSTSGCSRGR